VTQPERTGQQIPEPGAAGEARRRAEGPFGEANRAQLLEHYFAGADEVTPAIAWQHAYRLLLWIDRSIGLAHCYESDKCQPGRPWYARSLAFHGWLAGALGTSPAGLAKEVDLLFRWVTKDLAARAAGRRAALAPEAVRQRQAYAGQGFPEPGEDPELEAIITEALGPWLRERPSAEELRQLAERIHAHVGLENKRKNLLGEGFEDTIAAILRHIPSIDAAYSIHMRPRLHTLPGFYPPREREPPPEVDLALVRRANGGRTLVTCKWSVRSDRERQFGADFLTYTGKDQADGFDYVLVTNEFDPARLAAACVNRRENALIFSDVVHVNLDGPLAAYSSPAGAGGERGGIARVRAHAASGRLTSLSTWLSNLADGP